jgi:glycosyltransferase involved in cell wall biosynthesis
VQTDCERHRQVRDVKLSIYTGVKDGLFYDFHIVPMLRHHLELADEIIVNEGYSTDGTFEAISSIDPKIQVHRFEWDRSDPNGWHRAFKNQARRLCSGDWCILLDSDEFIPEWEFERLRCFLERTDKLVVPVRFLHFYGNYKVYLERHDSIIPTTGHRIHRNLAQIEVWGDGANIGIGGKPVDGALIAAEIFEVHHFGTVRHPARLRQKWRTQARQHNAERPRWDRTPSFLFDLFPHEWEDPSFLDGLALYEGPYIKAVREDPGEFIRDDFKLLQRVQGKSRR